MLPYHPVLRDRVIEADTSKETLRGTVSRCFNFFLFFFLSARLNWLVARLVRRQGNRWQQQMKRVKKTKKKENSKKKKSSALCEFEISSPNIPRSVVPRRNEPEQMADRGSPPSGFHF